MRRLLAIVLVLLVWSGMAQAAATKITVQSWFAADSPDALATEAIAEFEKEHPGVKVEWQIVGWDQYFGKALVQAAAGTSPDIHVVTFAEMDATLMQMGVLEPLDKYTTGPSGFDLRDFDQPVLKAAMMDGRLYYIPARIGFMAWYYNQEMVNRLGIREPAWGWKWDDLLANAKKMTRDNNGDGQPDQYGVAVQSWPLMVYEFIFGAGGHLFDDESTLIPNKAVYNSPDAVRGFSFYADLVNQHQVSPVPGQGNWDFTQGNIGFYQSGTYLVSRLKEQGKFDSFGVTLGPQGKVPYLAQGGGTGYGITKGSKNKDLAWELVKKLTDTQVLVQIGKSDSAVVTRRSARARLGMSLENNRLWAQGGNYFNPVSVLGFDDVLNRPLDDAIQQAVRGEAAYQTLLDEAVRKSNNALSTWRKYKR